MKVTRMKTVLIELTQGEARELKRILAQDIMLVDEPVAEELYSGLTDLED